MALATLVLLPVSPASAQDKCTCEHLDAIRKQLKKAQGMADYYRRSEKELDAKEQPILKNNPGGWEAAVKELRAESDKQIGTDTETLVRFDNDTCEPNPEDMTRQMAAASCRELAEATKRHEDYHHDVCVIRRQRSDTRRTSWPISEVMRMGLSIGAPSADRWEEAAAYELEVAELRALINRLTRYVLNFKSVARIDWNVPLGPAGTAAEYGSTARIPLEVEDGPAPQRVSGRTTRIFEGRIIGGTCQYTGMPMHIPMTVDGTLNENMFKLKIDKDGQRMPPFGVQCRQGSGMAPPGTAPPPPTAVEIEARDGARFEYPYVTSAAAMMISAVARLSGDATLEVEQVCKPDS